MEPADKASLDKLIADELQSPWLPNPGPQSDAFYSQADLLLYGGAAGGGKTDLLLGLALTQHKRSVIFRRAYVDLRGVEERLIEIRGTREGYNGADMLLRSDGRVLEFGALEKPGSEFSWQGRPHDLLGFDEGAQLSASKVAFVLGWLRTTLPGQRTRAVIASNPPMGGEGDWLIEWFAPWLDPLHPNPAAPGEIRWAITVGEATRWADGPEPVLIDGDTYTPLSRTFIPALLEDNPYLRETGYRSRIQNLPEPLRSQLLKGDFLAGREDDPWQVIPTAWIDLAEERWRKSEQPRTMDAIGVDVAQGGPDDTVLAPVRGVRFDPLVREKGVDTKDGPAVAGLVLKTMRHGAVPVIDMTGGWGISARDHLSAQNIDVEGIVFSAASSKRTKKGDYYYANMRSELWWAFREALDPAENDPREMPALPPDRRLRAQLTAPRWKLRGAAVVIEAKDEIRKRLGASTDDADAVILGWHGRTKAAVKRLVKVNRLKKQARMSDPLGDFR
jgi:hypothetical protein